MKKVFVVSLLLVSIFLIGSSELALAQCNYYQDYECTITKTQNGEVVDIFTDCVELCYNDFNVSLYDPFCFDCYLYPIDSRHLLGTASTLWGWAGCSVEFRGGTLIAKLTFVQENQGYVDIIKCKPCDGCCFD